MGGKAVATMVWSSADRNSAKRAPMTTARTSEGERLDIEDRPEGARSGLLLRAVGDQPGTLPPGWMTGCHVQNAGPQRRFFLSLGTKCSRGAVEGRNCGRGCPAE